MPSIEDIFSDFRMKKRPSHEGEYRGRCWFRENHQDGTGRQSMFISTEKNSYHCFSCGASGSLISALTIDFGVPVYEALDMINLIPDETSGAKKERQSLNVLLPIRRPQYYIDRGFSKKQLAFWSVGQEKDDRGRDLIVVPFFLRGKVIALQYTHVKPSGEKFVWTTEFDKSDYFYGIDKCNKESDEITLVEGITDTWRVFYWGLNVVGNLGTELTEGHVQLLQSNFPNLKTVYLGYDNDVAGFGAKENAHFLLRRHFDVRFLFYAGDDPDACEEDSFLAAYDTAPDYATYQVLMYDILGDEYAEIQEKALKRARKKGLV